MVSVILTGFLTTSAIVLYPFFVDADAAENVSTPSAPLPLTQSFI
jgi:hypothetical protein